MEPPTTGGEIVEIGRQKQVTFDDGSGTWAGTPSSEYLSILSQGLSSTPPTDPYAGGVGLQLTSRTRRWARELGGVLGKMGLLGSSDSTFDAWLTATAAQVGLIVLSLPCTFSQMGIAWTVGCFVGFGLLGWWAVYLLSWMYFDYKAKTRSQENPLPEAHVVQYHEVIGGMAGTLAGYVTFCFIIGGNALGAVVSVVSAASNLYYASDFFDKRQWTFVIGFLSMVSIFLPNFKHFRAISIVGVLSSSITAVYLNIASQMHGQVENVRHSGPMDPLLFFTGITNLIFSFGGQNITIEIMDAMKQPSQFNYVYMGVVGYTLAFVIPSGFSVYWANGDIMLNRSNAFAVIPKSGWRTFSIALMVSHQVVIYIVVAVTVFIAFEKAAGVHTGRYILRVVARIPIVLSIWVVALAIPFFGLINSLMGAFLVTAGGYVIPPLFFFVAYSAPAARKSSVWQPPLLLGRSWMSLFVFNGVVLSFMVNVGMGWGGWASVSSVIQQITALGLFDNCYQCPPKSD